MTVINAPCEIGIQLLDECGIDAIVTDPPYELGFMGKTWDKSGITNNVEMWRRRHAALLRARYRAKKHGVSPWDALLP